jgi:cytochrome c biogenesis factor
METLLGIVDFIVLLLLVVQIPRMVWKEQPHDIGSLLLSIFIALALIIFATVSFAAFLGLVQASSSLMRGIYLVVLLGMAAVLRLSWMGKPVT